MRPLAALALALLACTDASPLPHVPSDADTHGDSGPDSDLTDGACRILLTEVDATFLEAKQTGNCTGWSLAIRRADETSCPLESELPLSSTAPSPLLFEDLTVPPQALLTLRDPAATPHFAWLIGRCDLAPDCASSAPPPSSLVSACLPGDPPNASLSVCGKRWVVTDPTPGAPNDCGCAEDCAALAPPCTVGRCLDAGCTFAPSEDGAPCDDANLCTRGDTCLGGSCQGTPATCVPEGPCEDVLGCDPATGACLREPHCAEGATCTRAGCTCLDGFRPRGDDCVDVDECANGSDRCESPARCVNTPGTYACACPPGYAGDGWTCVPSNCPCRWEHADACGPALKNLKIKILDIWGEPLNAPTLTLIDLSAGEPAAAITSGPLSAPYTLPLCGPRAFSFEVAAKDHHAYSGRIVWEAGDLTVDARPSPDAAWVLTGDTLTIGLAHRWFAASGRPPRKSDVELYLSHETAWSALRTELLLAERLITGTSWKWKSDFELARDARAFDLPTARRWDETLLGLLEEQEVETKLIVNQFVSQDGLFSDLSVDDALLARASDWSDPIEYMGQANPSSGELTVTLSPVDLGSRLDINPLSIVDDSPSTPFTPPIRVDLNEVPFGLSNFELPIASWHQKFWTFDEAVAFIGGMNADTVEWDSASHAVFDPRRMAFDATPDARRAVARKEALPDHAPYKDYMVRVEGPLVDDAVSIFHARWRQLLDADVTYADRSTPFTPTRAARTVPNGVKAQLLTTMPAPYSEYSIFESLLRAISQAEHLILIEDQYFRAPILYDRIVARMQEVPGLTLIVVTNPISEWTDPACWQTALAHERFAALFPDRFRVYRLRTFDHVRLDCTFCWDETEAHFLDIYLHSKLVLIDDVYLEVGSCNSNNRGLLYEGELALAVHDPTWVRTQRNRVVSSLLGFAANVALDDLLPAFDEAAAFNESARLAWEDASMDLDLDGDPIPPDMLPRGFLYPLSFDSPDACLLEGIGPDIM